jgi:hypothetical protein
MRGDTWQVLRAWLSAGLLLLGLFMLLKSLWRDRAGEMSMDGWKIEDLVLHLQRKGLEFRVVPSAKEGPLDPWGVYLTTTDKSWEQLIGLLANPDFIDARWQGTVYCNLWAIWQPFGDWGDRALRLGPFIFIGDPEMLVRIRAALRAPAPRSAPTGPTAREKQRPTFVAE